MHLISILPIFNFQREAGVLDQFYSPFKLHNFAHIPLDF